MPSNTLGHILPQDTDPGDSAEEVIVGQPVSQNEIDDLLYGEDRPVGERVERLGELAEQLRARRAGDLATDDDTDNVLDEIERAIDRLNGASSDADDQLAYGGDVGILAQDPEDHLDALSPDDDARLAITGEDELTADENLKLDEEDWDEADDATGAAR